MNYKKILHVIIKVVFSLIILVPILGVLGVFPPPTRELYNTDEAFAFVKLLTDSGYVMWMMAVVELATLFALWSRREALGAFLMLPVTLNIVGFHAFFDGGIFTAGAILGDILFVLNLYLLYKNRETLKMFFAQR